MHSTPRPTTELLRQAGRLALLLLLLSGLETRAEDWPLARGNLASTGRAATPLPAEPELLWTFESEDSSFEAGVVVEQGKIYVGDVDGTMYAIDLATGKKVWSKKFDDAGFVSAAAVAGDRLWVGDFMGILRCLRTSDGEEVWQYQLAAEMMAGPMLYDGKVLVTTEGGTLTSLDAATGEKKWETMIDAPLRCTPTVVDGKAMISGCDSKLHAYNLETGAEEGAIDIDGPSGSTPAARDGKLYFGTEQGTFYCIDVSKTPMEVVWQFADPKRRQGIRTAAALGDEVVVYGTQAKAAYGLDLASGKQVWIFPTRTRVESSPVVAGGRAVVATQRGKLSLVDLADGKEEWEYDAGGGFLAAAVVVDGKLVIGNTDGKLYAFGAK